MKNYCWVLGLFLVVGDASSQEKGNPAKEARLLAKQAAQESDQARAVQLRTKSCALWEQAYQASKKPEFLLETGYCKEDAGQLSQAEEDFRKFLVSVSPTHKFYAAAQEKVDRLVIARQQAELLNLQPRIVAVQPLVVEDSPAQRRRRFTLVAGGIVGAVLGGVVFGTVQARQDTLRPERLVTEEQ